MNRIVEPGALREFVGLAFAMYAIPRELTGKGKVWRHCLPPTDNFPEERFRRFMPDRPVYDGKQWETSSAHYDPSQLAEACFSLIPSELYDRMRQGCPIVTVLPVGTATEEYIRQRLRRELPHNQIWKLCGAGLPYGHQHGGEDFLARVYLATEGNATVPAHELNHSGSFIHPMLVEI